MENPVNPLPPELPPRPAGEAAPAADAQPEAQTGAQPEAGQSEIERPAPSSAAADAPSAAEPAEPAAEDAPPVEAEAVEVEAGPTPAAEQDAGLNTEEFDPEGSSAEKEKEKEKSAAMPGPAADKAMPGPAIPGAALPGGDDEDDEDFEIPDEVEYGDIVRGEADDAAAPAETSAPGVLAGVVAGLRADGAFVDIGRKSEAFLPIAQGGGEEAPLRIGDRVEVTVSGTSAEGYLLLQSLKAQRPKGWAQLEAAFASGGNVVGKVSEAVRGGLVVDVGARAFLPGSRSGEPTEEGLQALVGSEIHARIVHLDEEDRNVVLDRRVVLEEERESRRLETVAGLKRGDTVSGVVRNMRNFGAFVDLGGVDALLHVSDMSWRRVNDPSDILHRGQQIEVKVLAVEDGGRRISVGLKQLQPDPWTLLAEKIRPGDRIRGAVTRLKDFGAFVEVEPGIDGLVHVSEMSWNRRVRHPSEVVAVGDMVEVAVLDVRIAEKRIALGLKQALGDPWERLEKEYPVGAATTGTVRKITQFGAFVEIFEGMDGLLHISDIAADRRLKSPGEVLREGREVRVKVLEIDREKRRLKLGMKQLEPTEQESFMSEARVGDTVTGRIAEIRGNEVVVEVGDGVRGICLLQAKAGPRQGRRAGASADLSSMTSMLEAAWKGGDGERKDVAKPPAAGSVHTFTVTGLDAERGLIELAFA